MAGEEPRILNSSFITDKKNNQKQTKQFIILGVLLVVLLYLLFTTFFKGSKAPVTKPATSAPAAVTSSTTINHVQTLTSDRRDVTKNEGEDWGQNPFSADRKPTAGSSSTYQLQGIVVKGKGGSYALINDQILRVDDKIGTYTVTDIQADQAVLKSDKGEDLVLKS